MSRVVGIAKRSALYVLQARRIDTGPKLSTPREQGVSSRDGQRAHRDGSPSSRDLYVTRPFSGSARQAGRGRECSGCTFIIYYLRVEWADDKARQSQRVGRPGGRYELGPRLAIGAAGAQRRMA